MNILFVCAGNVARSQMAEAMFNQLSDGAHIATSAGVNVIQGNDSSREGQLLKDYSEAANTIAVMQEVGVDFSRRVRKHVTQEMVTPADTVVAMVNPESVPDLMRDNPKLRYWEVSDPYKQSLEFTRTVRNQIHSLVGKLLKDIES